MIEIPQEEKLPTSNSSEHDKDDNHPNRGGREQAGEEEGEGQVVDVEGIMKRTGCVGSMQSVLAKPLCPGVQRFVELISVYEGRVRMIG